VKSRRAAATSTAIGVLLAVPDSPHRRVYNSFGHAPEGPSDALLLIEVAEGSLAEVHHAPDAGGYRDVSRVAGTGTVAVRAFPDITLTLAEIFA